MDTSYFKLMKRHGRIYRFMGAMFCLTGSVLLITFLPLLLDENATINYNGAATSDFGPKLSAVLFTGSFVVIGLAFLFSPNRYLNRLFIWRQSLIATIFPKRK